MENLGIVIPSEVSQTEKDKCHITLHYILKCNVMPYYITCGI